MDDNFVLVNGWKTQFQLFCSHGFAAIGIRVEELLGFSLAYMSTRSSVSFGSPSQLCSDDLRPGIQQSSLSAMHTSSRGVP